MSPDEICRRLGEAKFKDVFHSLNAASMKKILAEANIPAVRLPSHSSTKKRNEDWASRLWKQVGPAKAKACAMLLFEWLSQTRKEMLATFLDAIGVPHQGGLTDADFLKETPEDKLIEAGKALLANGKFDPREVAAYFLFLDVTSSSQKFAALDLDQHLPPPPA